MTGKYSTASFVLTIGGLLLSGAPFAQPASSELAADNAIEEILVTARRREEDIQSVPLSMASFDSDQLQERMVFDIEDIAEFVPNVTMGVGGQGSGGEIVIRGIGGGGTADPRLTRGANLYVDGVYNPNAFRGLLSTVEVERTEILRGPQGTMFGRNSSGGAVNVVTKRPSPDFEASVVLRAGEFGQRDARGSINLPLVDDKLFVRGALAYEDDDGYYTEVRSGRGYQDKGLEAFHLSARWLATERWTVDFTGQHAERSRNGRGGNCNYTGRTIFNGFRHESGGGGNYEVACNASRDAGPYAFYSEFDGFNEFESTGFYGVAAWDSEGRLGRLDNASVKLSAAIQETSHKFLNERDYTWERLASLSSFIYPSGEALGRDTTVRSLEALFQGTALDGRLDFSVGYNRSEDEGGPQGQDCAALYERVAGTAESITCSRPGGLYLDFVPLGGSTDGTQEFAQNSADSLFFHGTFDISENWFADLGGRWTSEDRWFKSMIWSPGNVIAGRDQLVHELSDDTVEILEQDTQTWEEFTPTASLSWRLPAQGIERLDEGIVYLSYSEGFNSGGFNYGIPRDVLGAFYAYDPEEVRAYEVGLKSQWNGGRLKLNVAAFLTDYTDKQVEIIVENSEALFGDPEFGFIDNVAEVEITGVEVEAELRTDGGFVFQAAASYMSNEFSEYRSFDAEEGVLLDLGNLNIEDLTPDYTLSATAQYTYNHVSGSALTSRLGVYWQDDYDYGGGFRSDPPSTCYQEAYSKFHARLTWENAARDTRVALFGTNINDELILNSCINSRITGRRIQYQAPSRWGVEVTLLFGG